MYVFLCPIYWRDQIGCIISSRVSPKKNSRCARLYSRDLPSTPSIASDKSILSFGISVRYLRTRMLKTVIVLCRFEQGSLVRCTKEEEHMICKSNRWSHDWVNLIPSPSLPALLSQQPTCPTYDCKITCSRPMLMIHHPRRHRRYRWNVQWHF